MSIPSRLISIAPMMDWTDRHCRYFLRLIAPDVLLYTEMITALSLLHGDVPYLLRFHEKEHPVALQLGGNDPRLLADCAEIGESFGYDEINLNVGCPSPRVSVGQFGACLMREPALVADCVDAMQHKVRVPVTVKCRIGVDESDAYEDLYRFIDIVAAAGCQTFIVHARKAWLNGLSPKQNREVPPLHYDRVVRLKKDFPALTLIINGGIKTTADIAAQLLHVDGVMIGRAAYANPYLLADVQAAYYPNKKILTRAEVIEAMLPYISEQLKNGTNLPHITRHLFGLFQGVRGAAAFRRHLSEQAYRQQAGVTVLEQALALVAA